MEAHIEAGGIPDGIVVFETEGMMARLKSRLLAEHVGNQSLERDGVTIPTAEIVARDVVIVGKPYPQTDER